MGMRLDPLDGRAGLGTGLGAGWLTRGLGVGLSLVCITVAVTLGRHGATPLGGLGGGTGSDPRLGDGEGNLGESATEAILA